jgi:PAS domain S-box-containing protein
MEPNAAWRRLQEIRLKVVEASPDAKIVVNKARDIIDMNEEAEFLFGYARSDLLGRKRCTSPRAGPGARR